MQWRIMLLGVVLFNTFTVHSQEVEKLVGGYIAEVDVFTRRAVAQVQKLNASLSTAQAECAQKLHEAHASAAKPVTLRSCSVEQAELARAKSELSQMHDEVVGLQNTNKKLEAELQACTQRVVTPGVVTPVVAQPVITQAVTPEVATPEVATPGVVTPGVASGVPPAEQVELEHMRSERDKQKTEIEHLKTELAAARLQAATHKTKNAHCTADLAALRLQVNTQKKKIEKLNAELAEQKKKFAQCEADLATAHKSASKNDPKSSPHEATPRTIDHIVDAVKNHTGLARQKAAASAQTELHQAVAHAKTKSTAHAHFDTFEKAFDDFVNTGRDWVAVARAESALPKTKL